MTIPENYRKPILFAVIFHVILLCVLIFSFAPSLFRMPPSSAAMKTVHATAVSEASVQTEIRAAQKNPDTQKIQQQQKEAEHQKLMQAQQAALAHQKLMRERERASAASKLLAQQKALVLQQEKKIRSQALARAQKAAQQKAAQQKASMEARAKANATLAAEQKKLQQELMQQQMVSEQKNISAVVSQAQQGAIDKYKAEILSAIQSNWRIDQINAKLKCIYTVQIAPDGTVLSIKLVQSSGDSALDQSAQQAITLASPLPVPHNPVLFNHFRQLVLTLSPQGVLQSVGTA